MNGPAFGRRCIPPGGVAPPLNTGRYSQSSRLANRAPRRPRCFVPFMGWIHEPPPRRSPAPCPRPRQGDGRGARRRNRRAPRARGTRSRRRRALARGRATDRAPALRRRRADQGSAPRQPQRPLARGVVARPPGRRPRPAARARLLRRRGADPRPQHRRQHHDVQRGARDPPAAARLRRSRCPRGGAARGPLPCGAGQLPRLARPDAFVQRHGRGRDVVAEPRHAGRIRARLRPAADARHAADARRRAGAGAAARWRRNGGGRAAAP